MSALCISRLGAALLLLWLAAGCSTFALEPLPEPIRPPKEPPAAAAAAGDPTLAETPPTGPRTTRTPGVVIQRTVAEGAADRLGDDLEGEPIRISFHDVPLVPFINEVFGEELGLSFVIAPRLRQRSDLVTLKLTEPLPPRRLFATARRVLREYGVDLREVEGGHPLLRSEPGRRVARRAPARQRPDPAGGSVHASHHLPVRALGGPCAPRRCGDWLGEAFDRQDLKVLEDAERNALLLKGTADMIARALAMIEVLDQPLLARAARGHHRAHLHAVP